MVLAAVWDLGFPQRELSLNPASAENSVNLSPDCGGSLMCQAAQPANVEPTITLNSSIVSGTSQNAVVGQEILLSGNPANGI